MATENDIIVNLIVDGVDEFKAQLSSSKSTVTEVTKSIAKLGDESKKEFQKLIAEIDKCDNEFEKLDKSIKLTKSLIEFSEDANEVKLLTNELKKAESEFANLSKAQTQSNKQGESFKAQLRQSREELAKVFMQGGVTTSQIYNLAKSGGALKDSFGDASQAISVLSSDTFTLDATIQGVQTLTSAFQIGQGVSALFGVENEKLQKTLVQLNGLMAISSGLQQIQNSLQAQSALRLKASVVWQGVYNTVVGESIGVMRILRIVTASLVGATGIGLLLIALATLYANFDKVNEAIKRTFPNFKGLGKIFSEIKDSILDFVETGLNSFVRLYNASEIVRKAIFGIGATFASLKEALIITVKPIIDIFSGLGKILLAPFTGNVRNIGTIIKDTVKEVNKTISDGTKNIGKNFSDAFKSAEISKLNAFDFDMLKGKGEKAGVKIKEGIKKELEKPTKVDLKIEYENPDIEGYYGELISKLEKELKQLFTAEFVLGNNAQDNPQIRALVSQLDVLKKKFEDAKEQYDGLFTKKTKPLGLTEVDGTDTLDFAKKEVEKTRLTQKEYELRLNMQREFFEQGLISEEEYNDKSKQLQEERGAVVKENAEKAQDVLNVLMSIANEAFSLASNIIKQRSENELATLEDKRKRGVISEKQYEKEVAKVKFEAAKKQHAIETAQAFAKVPQVVLNALVTMPFPANIAIASIFGAFALAQAVLVAKNKPKFKDGGSVEKRFKGSGYVTGKSHEQGGVNAELQGNEYVIKGEAVSKYGIGLFDKYNNMEIDSPFLTHHKRDIASVEDSDMKNSLSMLNEKLVLVGSYTKQNYKTVEKSNEYLKNIESKLGSNGNRI